MNNLSLALLGQRLKAVRKYICVTQAYTAALLNVPLGRYVSWEHGKAEPPLHILHFFCSRFHVSADYLIGLTEEMMYSDLNEYVTHADLTPLSLDARHEAFDFIRFLTEREAEAAEREA